MNPDPNETSPIHCTLGVLRDDGKKVHCHVCGEWFLHLAVRLQKFERRKRGCCDNGIN